MNDATAQAETPAQTAGASAPMIHLEGVWKIFGERAGEALAAIRSEGMDKAGVLERFGAVVGVADVGLSVARGEIFCVMGLSGSGKSTLVRHINRLLEPTDGRIFVDGTDVMALPPRELQDFRNRRIGMVFQNFALMPHRSVLDNVAMPLEIRAVAKNDRMRRAHEALELVELQRWGNRFAHELSGGMQQRVGLARALAADPDILLMDEPFSALDPLIRRQLQDEFIGLSARMDKTTVFITHDLDEAVRIGDHIAIMRDGRVVQVGTPSQILMHPADEYVADFVSGISPLKVVSAASLMTPIPAGGAAAAGAGADAPRVRADQPLGELLRMAIDHPGPYVVRGDDGDQGILTRRAVLEAVGEHGAGE
jgi:glycine betaine/proline transport system ATP-binding protein